MVSFCEEFCALAFIVQVIVFSLEKGRPSQSAPDLGPSPPYFILRLSTVLWEGWRVPGPSLQPTRLQLTLDTL